MIALTLCVTGVRIYVKLSYGSFGAIFHSKLTIIWLYIVSLVLKTYFLEKTRKMPSLACWKLRKSTCILPICDIIVIYTK